MPDSSISNLDPITGALVDVDTSPLPIDVPADGRTRKISVKELVSKTKVFTQSGTGAVTRTVQDKERDIIHVKDFKNDNGTLYAGDGIQDDTTAVERAKVAAWGKTLHISGNPLITATLVFDFAIKLLFDGPSRTDDGNPFGSHFRKASSLDGPCVLVTEIGGQNFTAEGGGVVGVAGNQGDNIVLNSANVIWRNPISWFAGRDGIRLGGAAGNANGFTLINPVSSSNGGYGFHLHSDTSNCNAGLLMKPQCQSNALGGIYADKASANVIDCPLSEANVGWGLHLGPNATSNTIVGGDIEANIGGDILIDPLITPGGSALINVTISAFTVITNNEPTTTILNDGKLTIKEVEAVNVRATGAVGPAAGFGAWGPVTHGPHMSLNGLINIAPVTTSTMFTMVAGQSVLASITQGVENYTTVAIIIVPDGGTTAVVTELYKTNANLVFAVSGLDVQATNGTGGTRTIIFRALRFF